MHDSGLPVCEIITIGSELLFGQITDTNTTYLARELGKIGVNVRFRTAVGDRLDEIIQVIRLALKRCDIVITSGGLGPTLDDMTREAVAQAVGMDLEFREDLMEEMGFPNYNERLDIYAWLPADQMRELAKQAYKNRHKLNYTKDVVMNRQPNGLVLYDSFQPSLFYDALMLIEDPAKLRMIMVDFQYLIDAVLRAKHKDMSVENAWNSAAVTANAYVSTGLDYLSDGDIEVSSLYWKNFI